MRFPKTVHFGPYRFDSRSLEVFRGGRPEAVPPRAAALLRRLIETPGEVVGKAELAESVWKGTHVSSSSLTEAMSQLRTALADDARRPRYVETLPGLGYRFVGRVRVPLHERLAVIASAAIWRGWASAAAAAVVGVIVSIGSGLALGMLSTVEASPPIVVQMTESGQVVEEVGLPPVDFDHLTPSPDGRRLALSVPVGRERQIWVFDRDDSSFRRVSDGGDNVEVIWSPDGEWLTWASDRFGNWDVLQRRADGRGETEALVAESEDEFPEAWLPGGAGLLYTRTGPGGDYDIAFLRRIDGGDTGDIGDIGDIGDRSARWSSEALVSSGYDEYLAAVSPDGQWLAFASNRSGAWGVYVRSMNGGGEAIRVSAADGVDPFWSTAGSTLYFLSGDRLMRATPGLRGFTEPPAVERLAAPQGVMRARAAGVGSLIAALPRGSSLSR